MHKSCVYVIKVETGRIKIGCTSNLESRLKSFHDQQWPYKWELIHTIATDKPQSLEQRLHRLYRKYRVNGEWFELPANITQQLLFYTTEDDVPYLREPEKPGQEASGIKTRTLRLSDEAWDALLTRAKRRGLRGRAQLLEELLKKKEQPVDSQAQPDTIKEEIPAVQTSRPVRAVPKPAKKK